MVEVLLHDILGTAHTILLHKNKLNYRHNNIHKQQIHEVQYTIFSLGSWVSDFTGNSCAQKLNKTQTKQANISTGGIDMYFIILIWSIIILYEHNNDETL